MRNPNRLQQFERTKKFVRNSTATF